MSRIGLELQIDRLLKIEEKYNQLIMAVESKYPGETRHETAMRYINDRENGGNLKLVRSGKAQRS